MLARSNRLRRRSDIDNVYRRGKPFRGDELSLRLLPNKHNELRLVVVVGKKVSKKAVVRNHIRRRLSALLSELADLSSPHDVVISASTDISLLPPEQLGQQLTDCLAQAGLLKASAQNAL
jgi:ribonuclease P protein component